MMKIIKLCREGSRCPELRIADDHVEIGEKDNVCVLTIVEWETLKEKLLVRKFSKHYVSVSIAEKRR